jgi:hypothetical protein
MAASTRRPRSPSRCGTAANQGNKSHKDVEATIIHHLNTYTNITATKPKPFPDGKQADILLSGVTTIDNPAARNWHLTSRQPTLWGSPTRS